MIKSGSSFERNNNQRHFEETTKIREEIKVAQPALENDHIFPQFLIWTIKQNGNSGNKLPIMAYLHHRERISQYLICK